MPIYEDIKTKRVCFSDTISGCLSALQNFPQIYYVYVPVYDILQSDLYFPSVDEVIDVECTHEIWVLKKVEVKCIGKIQSDDYDWIKQYDTGKGTATFFHYPYKWIY